MWADGYSLLVSIAISLSSRVRAVRCRISWQGSTFRLRDLDVIILLTTNPVSVSVRRRSLLSIAELRNSD